MLTTERQLEILSILNKKKAVTVSQLCAALYVSAATIRRDLVQLERAGLLRRSHGGAILVEGGNRELSVLTRSREHVQAKNRIAQLAALYIKNGNTLFLDSSSSVACIIPYLAAFREISVITNGLHCALSLSETTNCHVYLPAGQVISRTNSLVGSETLESILHFNADVAVVSCSGISQIGGITEASVEQSRIKQAMLRQAKTKILLCDNSKFNQIYFSRTCGVEDFDYLICEEDPGAAWRAYLAPLPCELVFPEG